MGETVETVIRRVPISRGYHLIEISQGNITIHFNAVDSVVTSVTEGIRYVADHGGEIQMKVPTYPS